MTAPGQVLFGPPEFLADDTRVLDDEHRLAERAAAIAAPGPTSLEQLFLAANLLALALVRLGETVRAQRLCRSEIAYARSLRGTPHQAEAAVYGLEAQVNLIRVDALQGRTAAALAGFAELERIADGRPARLPELSWDPAVLGNDVAQHRKARVYARNVLVIDTCKALLRSGDTAALTAEAQRYVARWPKSVRAGLHHPAEAPYLVDPAGRPEPVPGEGSLPERRLAFIQLLHLAAGSAQEADPSARERAERADRCWTLVQGTFSSPGTLPRWQASLGSTMLAVGRTERGLELLRCALAAAQEHGDRALRRAVHGRLTAHGVPVPAEPPAGDRAAATVLAIATAERLAELLSRQESPARA
ncbi:hypothetical protein [Kitasatospora sp. NPDC002040]|uniref:hypothetical protein n=1 Tax=Kitasatospora sp. NPDC002040 TaxID=3154661 RepID=UPI00332D0447